MTEDLFDISTVSTDVDYTEERECDYKGEHYSVRDNGTIMRHSKEKKRPNDNEWTFGRKDPSSGYMRFCNEAVHRIVATAFHGEAPSSQHVVDHIDTNRCNNRPENLRWLTKLENILLNDTTRAKVEHICGSIEAFLENPQLLFGHETEDSNFVWMRAVSAEEAANTLANLERLQHKDASKTNSHQGMGGWVFNKYTEQWQPDFSKKDSPNIPSREPEKQVGPLTVNDLKFTDGTPISDREVYFDRPIQYDAWGNLIGPKPSQKEKAELLENNVSDYFETSNKLAQQIGWKPYTKPEFPCCPTEVSDNPLQEYAERLIDGKDFVTATYGRSVVYKYVIDGNQLLVITKIIDGVKDFGLTRITWNGKAFIHESMGTYFAENGVLAAFTRAQGKEWDGPDSIDDYC